jgi:pyruvate formate lyase activating enzyme
VTMKKGLIFDLKHFAMHDGPGIRLTVFLKGCPLKCWWCHNPEGMQSGIQTVPRENRIGSKIVACRMEEVGQSYTIDQLMAEIEKDVIFYDDSGGGVTFSGGEPLLQAEFLESVLKRCREMEIHTAVDTSGFASLETLQRIAGLTDLFLFDLKLINEDKHLLYTGVSNQRILNNLRWLTGEKKNLIVRFPVIPGITETNENIESLKLLLQDLKTVRRISLLPFHNIAAGKYERFGLENRVNGEESMTREHVLSLKAELESLDMEVTIGA